MNNRKMMNGNNSGGISEAFNSTKNGFNLIDWQAFETTDSLELRLQQRRPRQVLADQGIIPPLKSPGAYYGIVQKLDRARKEDFLNKAIQDRPDRKYLVDKHILEDTVVSSPIVANQKNLKKAKLVDDLNEKILFRPGVIELVEKNIIPADDVQEAIRDGQLVYKKIADFVDDDSSDSFSPEQPTAPPSVSPPLNFTLGCSEPITCNQMIDKVFVAGKKGSVGKSSLSFTQSSSHPYLNRQSSKGSKSNLISSSRGSGPRKKKEKPKLKNYKYHQYIPPGQQGKSSEKSALSIDQDSPYQRLLEQQQIFLQYQIIKQNEFAAGPHSNGGQRSCEHPSATSSFNQQSLPPPPPLISQRKIKLEHSLSNGSKLTFSKLDEMKVSELKEELKSRGLKVTGTKEVLIERLKPHCVKSSENIFTTLPDLQHGKDGIRSSDKQPRQPTTNGCHGDQQVIKMINGHHGNHVDDCMTSSNTAMFARKMPSPEKAKFVPKQEKMFNLATWNANVKDSRVISNTQIAPSSGGSKLDDKDKLLMLQQEQIQHLQNLLQFQEAKMNRMRSEPPQDVDQSQDVTGQTFMAQKINQQPPVHINSNFKGNEVRTNMQISSEPVTSSCHDNQDIENLFGLMDKPENHQQQQEMLPSNHVDYNQLPFEATQPPGGAFHDANEISDLLLRTSGDVLMDTNSFPLKMTPDPLNHYSRPSTCSSVDSGVIFNPSHFSPASIEASSRHNIPINDRTSTSSLDDVTEQTLNSAGCYRQPSTSYQQQLIKASSQEILTSSSSSDYFTETNALNWLDLPLAPQAPQIPNSTPLQPSNSNDLMTSSDIFDHLDCRSDPSMEWGGDWDCFLSGTDFNT